MCDSYTPAHNSNVKTVKRDGQMVMVSLVHEGSLR